MKIAQLEIVKVPPSWVWLFVHTDEGLTGLGEPFLENHADSVIAEVRRLEPLLIGQDPRRIEALWAAMYNAGLGYKGGPVTMSAISGIDMALWDLAGKIAGQPIHAMLGGACRDRVRMYRATGAGLPHCVEPGLPYRAGKPDGGPINRDDPQAWAEYARVLVQKWGFRCLKVHFSPGEGLEATSNVDRFAELFAAVREGAGPAIDVAVDIHNPHPRIAMQLITALEPHRPLFVEEPMPVERVDTLAEIARQTRASLSGWRALDGQVGLLRCDPARGAGGGPAGYRACRGHHRMQEDCRDCRGGLCERGTALPAQPDCIGSIDPT